MKHKKLIIILSAISIITTTIFSINYITRKDKDQYEIYNPLMNFAINYSIVKHNLKNDQDLFKDILYIGNNSKDGGKFFHDFWHFRILQKCNLEYKRIIDETVKEIGLKNTEALTEEARKRTRICDISYIYDNWEDINNSIVNKSKSIKRDSRFLGF